MANVQIESLMIRMVGLKARTRQVQTSCGPGAAEKRVRDLYWREHRDRPKSGKLPDKISNFLGKTEDHYEASLLAERMRIIGLVDTVSLASLEGGHAMCNAYESYSDMVGGKPRHDFTSAWVLLSKMIREERLDFKDCRDCGAPFLVEAGAPNRQDCPCCAMKASNAKSCNSCGKDLDENSRCKEQECRAKADKRRHRGVMQTQTLHLNSANW